MKKIILFLIFFTVLVSCASVQQGTSSNSKPVPDQSNIAPDTVEPLDAVDAINPAEEILRQYRVEGFVDQDTYSIIIVRPSDTSDTRAEILSQAKKRTLVSFTKYIRSQGKIVSGNTNASLLNLINEHGSLKQAEDTKQSRTVYVFIVKRDQLKRYIDGL